jgi:hypothetical protein
MAMEDLSGGGPARAIRETSGPAVLTIEDIADGQFLKREGNTIVGATAATAGGGGGVLHNDHQTSGTSMSYSLPGNTLTEDAQAIRIVAAGKVNAADTVRVRIGGQTIFEHIIPATDTPGGTVDWQIDLLVTRKTSTTLVSMGSLKVGADTAMTAGQTDVDLIDPIALTWSNANSIVVDYTTILGATRQVNYLFIEQAGGGGTSEEASDDFIFETMTQTSGASLAITVPGGTLAEENDTLRVYANFTADTAETVRIRFGGQTLATHGMVLGSGGVICLYIVRKTATTVAAWGFITFSGSGSSTSIDVDGGPSFTVTLSADQNVDVDFTTGGATRHVRMLTVEKLGAGSGGGGGGGGGGIAAHNLLSAEHLDAEIEALVPGSIFVVNDDSKAEQLPAGDENAILRMVSGQPTWSSDQEDPGIANPSTATMPDVFVKRSRSTGAMSLYALQGGISLSSAIGGSGVGSVESSTYLNGRGGLYNDCVRFQGKDYILQTHGTTSHNVYEKPINGSINTTPVRTETVVASALLRSGLMVVHNGTASYLCFVYYSSTATAGYRLCRFDGTSWVTTNLGTSGSAPSMLGSTGCAVVNGSVYVPTVATGPVGIIVNVISQTASFITTLTNNFGSFGSIYGRVFFMPGATSGSANQRTLYEVVGGALVSRLVFAQRTNDTTTTAQQGLIVPYGDSLLCFFQGNSGRWLCSQAEFPSALSTAPTETTRDTIVPAEMQETTVSSALPGRMYTIVAFIDTETNPANPEYNFFWYYHASATTNSNFSYAKLQDLSTQLVGVATSVDWQNHAPTANTYGGGHYIFRDGASDFYISAITVARSGTTSQRMVVSMTMQSVVTTDTFTAKLWYSTKQNKDFIQATLAGTPTGGCTRNGNQIEGIDHNTAITFEWDLATDLINDNTRVEILLKLYRE